MSCDLALILIVAAIVWMFSIVLTIKVYERNNRPKPMSIADHVRAIRKIKGKEDWALDGGMLVDTLEYGSWDAPKLEGIERAEAFVDLFRGPGHVLREVFAVVYVSLEGDETGIEPQDVYVLEPKEIDRDLLEEAIDFRFESDVFRTATIESFKVIHDGRILTSRPVNTKMRDGDILRLSATLKAKEQP
jgi:hypothetical protein